MKGDIYICYLGSKTELRIDENHIRKDREILLNKAYILKRLVNNFLHQLEIGSDV
jgi:hypothetical protein